MIIFLESPKYLLPDFLKGTKGIYTWAGGVHREYYDLSQVSLIAICRMAIGSAWLPAGAFLLSIFTDGFFAPVSLPSNGLVDHRGNVAPWTFYGGHPGGNIRSRTRHHGKATASRIGNGRCAGWAKYRPTGRADIVRPPCARLGMVDGRVSDHPRMHSRICQRLDGQSPLTKGTSCINNLFPA